MTIAAKIAAAEARIDAHPMRNSINYALEVIAGLVRKAQSAGVPRIRVTWPVPLGTEDATREVVNVVAESLGVAHVGLGVDIRIIESPGYVAIELAVAGVA